MIHCCREVRKRMRNEMKRRTKRKKRSIWYNLEERSLEK